MGKPVIKEVIIVEGRDDTRRLKEAVVCDTIETNGSAINEAVLQEIGVALNTRGAIVFTDPDFPGDKIRNTIIERFPDIKEAFMKREKAIARKGLGIEHASVADIKEALQNIVTSREVEAELVTVKEMNDWGLSGASDSRKRREYLTNQLNIGYANAGQLRKKINRYNIKAETIEKILSELDGEN
jgi:ribonuclease M5